MSNVGARLLAAVIARITVLHGQRERGDVPGWVMVTVMTAGLVVALFAVFKQAIVDAVQNAISQVVSGTDGSNG